MIGTYLHQVYFNCKALLKSQNIESSASEAFFKNEIKGIYEKLNLKSEEEFENLLFSKSWKELQTLTVNNSLVKIFYLINSIGEFNQPAEYYDELQRFKYEHSIQKELVITQNEVLQLILSSLKEYEFLNNNFKPTSHKSYFFLSHDIDSLYGSTLQDGLWAVKHFRPDVMLKIMANAAISKPHWFNIDLIMKMESEYEFRSTFYWLVNEGKIDQRQTNSDYDIKSKPLQNSLAELTKTGFENGLHKSISTDSFKTELNKLPENTVGNRFHYLKFKLPQAYRQIEEAGLKLDASLGFAEHYGFRNSYGYPFSPYNFETKQAYSFLELPLNIMDGTFQRYLKLPVDQTAKTVIQFIEANSSNALLSILWHNTFFTDYKYKGYKEEYKKILTYLYEEKFNNINQSKILNSFSWKH